MSWTGIHVDDFGFAGKLQIAEGGVAKDISSYTTRQFILRNAGQVVKTVTAVFDTDGTDGVLRYTFQDGDIDRTGGWQVQARIAKTGEELTSGAHFFYVEERID